MFLLQPGKDVSAEQSRSSEEGGKRPLLDCGGTAAVRYIYLVTVHPLDIALSEQRPHKVYFMSFFLDYI